MKRRKFEIASFLFILATSFCLFACDPYQGYDCGLYLDFEKPKDVDSIHVVIYKKDSIRHVLGDYVACRGCAESSIWVNLDNRYLKKEWEYGEFFLEETAYCNGKKTVFPAVSFTLKKNAVAYIQVYNDLLSHDNYSSNDIYSPFIPIQNECEVDSLYKIGVYNSEYCEE